MGLDVGKAVRVAGGSLAAAGALAVGAAAGAALERLVMLRTARRDESLPSPDFPTQVREVITSDGTCLHVEVDDPGGAASRLTVIFCHGYALSLDSWRYQRRDLQGILIGTSTGPKKQQALIGHIVYALKVLSAIDGPGHGM